MTAQTAGLTSLAPELLSAAGAAVTHSLTLLSDVAARADGLQAALACTSGPAVEPNDALGPVPASCGPTAPEAPGGQPATPGTRTSDDHR